MVICINYLFGLSNLKLDFYREASNPYNRTLNNGDVKQLSTGFNLCYDSLIFEKNAATAPDADAAYDGSLLSQQRQH